MSGAWSSDTSSFGSLEAITVSGNCKLRRIFTMKRQPPDTTDDDGSCCTALPYDNSLLLAFMESLWI